MQRPWLQDLLAYLMSGRKLPEASSVACATALFALTLIDRLLYWGEMGLDVYDERGCR